MTLVLIVDDVPAMAEQYAYDLKRLRGYETLIAKSGRTALESLTRDSVDCVILDLEMPGMDGFEVLRSVERLGLRVPIIVYTGTGDYDRCAQAIRLGAYSFIDKAEPMERVAQEVANAIERRRLTAEVTLLRHGFGLESPLVGTSPALTKLKEAIVRVAPVPSPALIVGESGTGKELVARELHRLGPNPKGPFIALNSAALPHELVESELFGHERGAFTGANATRKGAFEAASGGTLFLDEIGDLPLEIQPKLLRLLQEREYERVGEAKTRRADVRVVAASNRNLEQAVQEGRFREDLYYRLNVISLHMLSLRERQVDLARITGNYLRFFCRQCGKHIEGFSIAAEQAIRNYHWPGNLRELRNVVERAVILAGGSVIEPADLPDNLNRLPVPGKTPAPQPGARVSLEELENQHLRLVISQTASMEEAAQILGIDPATLYRKRKKLGM